MLSELRLTFRQLAHTPGFTVVALLTLALGIGVNTATFSTLNAMLFRTPYPNDGELVRIYRTSPQSQAWPHSAANILTHQERAKNFAGIAAVSFASFNLGEPGQPAERLRGLLVGGDFFPLLGIQPELGRTLTAEDDQPGRNNVIVISHALWLGRFGGDRTVVGRTLRLNGEPVTIIGVMPASFAYPQLWGQRDAWRPIAFTPSERENRGRNYLQEIARLKPGITLAQAQTEMNTLSRQLAAEFPGNNAGNGLRLMPLARSGQDEASRRITWFIQGIAGFVLLIACANLANLQFARQAARSRDHAIRAALGASRRQLMRSVLLESLVLALLGGGLGVLVAVWTNSLMGTTLTINGHRGFSIPLDQRVLAFTLVASIGSGLAFGLLPAWLAGRTQVSAALKQGGRGSTAGRAQHRLRHALIVAEVALALVLLTGASYFARGLHGFLQLDPGWHANHLVSGTVSLRGKKYEDVAARRHFIEQLQAQVATLPGVEHATCSDGLPTYGYPSSRTFIVEGRQRPAPGREPLASVVEVLPDYFTTLGLRLREGRGFTADDAGDQPDRVVINEALARAFWPGESPLGKRIGNPDVEQPQWAEIIGVVSDARAAAAITPPDSTFQIYRPLLREPPSFLALALSTSAQPDTLAPALRRIVAGIDADLAVYGVTTVRQDIAATLANLVIVAWLLSAFALLGLALAAIGIYGVIANAVVQRTNEIGIRVALGAQVRDILSLVLGQGLRLTLLGASLGLVGAWGVAQALRAVAPEFPAADILTTLAVAALLIGTAALACWLPARRAARIDPVTALRAE